MPDNKWWLAQNVKLASYGGKTAGSAIDGCTKDECGRKYWKSETIGAWGGTSGTGANIQGVCPSNWKLPVISDAHNLVTAVAPTITWTSYSNGGCYGYHAYNVDAMKKLTTSANACAAGSDYYGWAALKSNYQQSHPGLFAMHLAETHTNADDVFWIQGIGCCGTQCGYSCTSYCPTHDRSTQPVRCFRQL
jgi:uncharacterized protein (TIGR02145 family)